MYSHVEQTVVHPIYAHYKVSHSNKSTTVFSSLFQKCPVKYLNTNSRTSRLKFSRTNASLPMSSKCCLNVGYPTQKQWNIFLQIYFPCTKSFSAEKLNILSMAEVISRQHTRQHKAAQGSIKRFWATYTNKCSYHLFSISKPLTSDVLAISNIGA